MKKILKILIIKFKNKSYFEINRHIESVLAMCSMCLCVSNKKFPLIFLTLLLCSSTGITAQNLNDLLQTATENNLELKILKNEYLSVLEIAPQVSELPDPEVGAGFFPFPVETRLGAQRFRLSATQMFPWFGTLDSKKELALAKAAPLLERINAIALDIHFKVKTAYFKLYKIEKSQAILQKNIAVLASLERFALAKIESGKGTAADVFKIQIQQQKVEQEIAILETTKVAPLVEINQLLQRDLDTEIETIDSLGFVLLTFQQDSLMADIQRNHPMIRMFELQQEISNKTLVVNEFDSKPTFGAGLDYINVSRREVANLQENGRDIVQVRGVIKIPIFKQKYAAKQREEQLKILALEDKKTDLLLRFQAMIKKTYAQHKKAVLQRNLYVKQVELTTAAIQVIEAAYSTQVSRFDELLRLEADLINYELKLLGTVVDSHLAKAAIERFQKI